jgi:hypothetical protein
MMQTDILAKNMTATGVVYGAPTRLKAITISYVSSAVITLTDGNGGNVLWKITCPGSAYLIHVLLPGEGIRAYNSLYITISGAGTNATVVYG